MTKKTKEICILAVVLVVLFGFIAIMAANEKKNTDTTNTEPKTSETQTIDDKTTAEETSSEKTSSKIVSDNKSDDYILTVDNCDELKNILTLNAEMDSSYSEFAESYSGATIEFDGSVDYKDNHITYNPFTGESKISKYGYDILLSAGDYSDSIQYGPTFKIEDIRSHDVGGDAISKHLPDFMSIGSNVHIRAKVGTYDKDNGIFTLYYESIEKR